jgi:TRAP-type uncharacterized transport system substrate-binding protein
MSLSDLLILSRRDLLRTALTGALVTAACLSLSFLFLEPIPPRKIVLASGPEFSLYHQQAQRYKEVLAREGVTIEERLTEGAGENLRLLLDRKSGVDIAFLPGGLARPPETDSLVMIASLYYEPLWIFVRRGERIDSLAALAGKRVATGLPGSGTHALTRSLLAASDVTAGNTSLVPIPADHSQAALKNGEVDAVLAVGGARTPVLHAALTDPALELVSLAQADAYPRRFPFLTRRTLPAGAIDFMPLVPAREVTLVSSKAMLVGRDDLHPAITNLLLETIRDEHDDQGLFESPNEFPNVEQVDLRVSPDAIRHRRFGPNLAYRYVPFWVAAFLERFVIIVVPLLVVLLPMLNYLPQFLRWRVRSHIYRWYGELKLLEHEVHSRAGELPFKRWLADLDRIQHAAEQVSTPESFASEVYTLREHIDLVRRTVLAKAAEAAAQAG